MRWWCIVFVLITLGSLKAQKPVELSQRDIDARISHIITVALQRDFIRTTDGTMVPMGKVHLSQDETKEIQGFGERAVAPLSSYLDHSDSGRAQVLAARLLSMVGGELALAQLSKAAEHSPSPGVRLTSLICLQQYGWAQIQNVIQRIASSDSDENVRKQANQMLEAHPHP